MEWFASQKFIGMNFYKISLKIFYRWLFVFVLISALNYLVNYSLSTPSWEKLEASTSGLIGVCILLCIGNLIFVVIRQKKSY